MVEELEALPESYGKDRTLLWLRAYEEMDRHASGLFSFLGFGEEKYTPSLDNLEFFLDKIGHPPTIKTINNNGLVPPFFDRFVKSRAFILEQHSWELFNLQSLLKT